MGVQTPSGDTRAAPPLELRGRSARECPNFNDKAAQLAAFFVKETYDQLLRRRRRAGNLARAPRVLRAPGRKSKGRVP